MENPLPNNVKPAKKSFKSLIQNINDWLVSKISRNKKYPSVTYRYLSQSIESELSEHSGSGKLIAVSFVNSIRPATELTMFLCFSLANELNARILMVETLIKPQHGSLSDKLSLSSSDGFLQLASASDNDVNAQQYIQKTAVDSVDFLPSGASKTSSSYVLKKAAISKLIDSVASEYDYIVFLQDDIRIDTRYMIISNHVHLNLLVLEENHTYMHDVAESKKRYQESNVKNMRIVMTT